MKRGRGRTRASAGAPCSPKAIRRWRPRCRNFAGLTSLSPDPAFTNIPSASPRWPSSGPTRARTSSSSPTCAAPTGKRFAPWTAICDASRRSRSKGTACSAAPWTWAGCRGGCGVRCGGTASTLPASAGRGGSARSASAPYSNLGAESLHPLSPLTTTLTYGVVRPDGTVPVRVVYDHRVMDGGTIARAPGAAGGGAQRENPRGTPRGGWGDGGVNELSLRGRENVA